MKRCRPGKRQSIYSRHWGTEIVWRTYTLVPQIPSGTWVIRQSVEQLCQEALALQDNAPDSQGKARLLAEAGRVALFGLEIEAESTHLCQAALEMAERLELPEVQAEARITLSLILFVYSFDLEKAIINLKDTVAFTEMNGLMRPAARAHHNLAYYLYYTGDLTSAHQHDLRSVEISREVGDVKLELFALGYLTVSHCHLGQLHDVEKIIAEIEGEYSSVSESQSHYYLCKIRSSLLLFRGEWILALASIIKLREEIRVESDLQRLANVNLDLADAILELNRFGSNYDYEQAKSALAYNLKNKARFLPSLSRILLVCTRQKHFDEVHDWIAEEKDLQKLQEFDSYKMLKLRTDVELTFADGRWVEAVTACQALIEICQRTGHRWELARRLIDLADALAQRAEPGDQEIARQHLRQSLDMFTQMGAPGYVKVVQERLQALDSSA